MTNSNLYKWGEDRTSKCKPNKTSETSATAHLTVPHFMTLNIEEKKKQKSTMKMGSSPSAVTCYLTKILYIIM